MLLIIVILSRTKVALFKKLHLRAILILYVCCCGMEQIRMSKRMFVFHDTSFKFEMIPTMEPQDGFAAAHHAAWQNRDAILEVLLQNGANPDLGTNVNFTKLYVRLHHAAVADRRNCASYCLQIWTSYMCGACSYLWRWLRSTNTSQ